MRRYAFREEWQVRYPVDRVHDVLADVEYYPLWWSQVLAAAKTGPDDGVVLCRSVLPYTLELELRATTRSPLLLETSVSGDLEGWVRFRLEETGEGTRVRFEQEVIVASPLLAFASYAARPVLRWNHARMMAGCRTGLAARLAN